MHTTVEGHETIKSPIPKPDCQQMPPTHPDPITKDSEISLQSTKRPGQLALTGEQPALAQIKLLRELDAESVREEWKKDMGRLIRRSAIEKYGSQASSLSEVKSLVKKFETDHAINELISSLVENEFTVDPRMAAVAEDVSERVRRKFPKVKGILLLGSPVHGGAKIREATDSTAEPDLDWGIITDEELPWNDTHNIVDFVNEEMPSIKEKFGLPEDFHTCRNANPINKQLQVKNISDHPELLHTIPERYMNILYFHPSFPSEINERNRRLYLRAMNQLYRSDPEKWAKHVDLLLTSWRSIHEIKEKHFQIADRDRDRQMVEKVVGDGNKIMEQPFRQTLEDTKNDSEEKGISNKVTSFFKKFSNPFVNGK